jgi:hypothetical protein
MTDLHPVDAVLQSLTSISKTIPEVHIDRCHKQGIEPTSVPTLNTAKILDELYFTGKAGKHWPTGVVGEGAPRWIS